MRLNTHSICTLVALSAALPALGQDTDRFRPYLRFHSGDLEPLWGVDDHWSLGLGANLNGTFGGELSIENFERDWDYGDLGTMGEISSWHMLPEVRLRKPLFKGRLVPYLVGGIGPTFLQLNDKKPASGGHHVRAEGFSVSLAAGAGIEYFLADNIAFGVEGRYVWVNPIRGRVDDDAVDIDVSAPTFTFGLRIYFDENSPKDAALTDPNQPNRLYAGVRLGGAVLTESALAAGVELEPEESAWGGVLNQTGALLLGATFGPHLGLELSADSLEYRFSTGDQEMGEYGMGVVIPQLRLRFPREHSRWVPYATAGLGVAYGEFNDRRAEFDASEIRAKGLYPALRFGAGLEYFVASNFSFMADTGWTYSWGHKVRFDEKSGKGDFAVFSATLGFRVYLFNF